MRREISFLLNVQFGRNSTRKRRKKGKPEFQHRGGSLRAGRSDAIHNNGSGLPLGQPAPFERGKGTEETTEKYATARRKGDARQSTRQPTPEEEEERKKNVQDLSGWEGKIKVMIS